MRCASILPKNVGTTHERGCFGYNEGWMEPDLRRYEEVEIIYFEVLYYYLAGERRRGRVY